MFKPNEKFEIDERNVKCGYIRYSTSEVSTIKTSISPKCIITFREDSVASFLNSYHDKHFEVVHATARVDMHMVMISD